MKIPKIKSKYCKFCKKHTEHSIAQAKKRERSSLKKYALARLKSRSTGKVGFGNKGRYSRRAISQFKMTGAKTSKKVDLRFKCKVCNKITVQNKGFRTRKPVFE
ncbi:50S ribosomal protein L44e [Candidatus Woesearchaeota archaeon]|nr:50S ribosomal protein L44e [Candidatus Woesearchaeota archaeon]